MKIEDMTDFLDGLLYCVIGLLFALLGQPLGVDVSLVPPEGILRFIGGVAFLLYGMRLIGKTVTLKVKEIDE